MNIINGIKISESILEKLHQIIQMNKLRVRLDIIWIGNNFASEVYINKKKAQAKSIGIDVNIHHYESLSENKLIELIENLNKDDNVDGIMIQLPIVGNIDSNRVLSKISLKKDVDGLNPLSLGYLWGNNKGSFISATALAVMECIKHAVIYNDSKYSSEELSEAFVEDELKKFLIGKEVTIVNNSNLVGKPLAGILTNYFSTVRICHKYTKDLKSHLLSSDIIISGTGVTGLINKDLIPQNSILIDVGINETANGVGGDIDYIGAESKIRWITPVPGGVGPITVAMLLKNVVRSAQNKYLDK